MEKLMDMKAEFDQLITNLKQQRDEINVQLHLASMEAKEEWEKADAKWDELNKKINDIADEAKETGEEVITNAKTVAEELGYAYDRIKQRLNEK